MINIDAIRATMYPGLQLQASMAVRLAVLQRSVDKLSNAAIQAEYQATLNRLRSAYGLGVR